jgi:hypothetical protein
MIDMNMFFKEDVKCKMTARGRKEGEGWLDI